DIHDLVAFIDNNPVMGQTMMAGLVANNPASSDQGPHGRSISVSATNDMFKTAAADRPASEARFQQRKDRVHADAHHADYNKRREDERDVEVGAGDQHHVADAVVASDDLRDYGSDK